MGWASRANPVANALLSGGPSWAQQADTTRRIRRMASVIHTQADLDELLAKVPDDQREGVRQALLPYVVLTDGDTRA